MIDMLSTSVSNELTEKERRPLVLKRLSSDVEVMKEKLNASGNEDYVINGVDHLMMKNKCIFKKEDIFPLKDVEFEGIETKIPNNHQKLLSTYYGDYLQLPTDLYRHNHSKHDKVDLVKQIISTINNSK